MKFGRSIFGFGMVLLVLCLILAAISAFINRSLPAQSAPLAQLSEAEKTRLAEFFQVRRQLGDTVWPGWGTADIPVVVYNEAYAFLLAYPDPPAGWIKGSPK